MNISLPPALRGFIEAQVSSGRYSDASEVIRDSLRLLEAQGAQSPRVDLAAHDIEQLLSQVMMESARSAREDLRDVMNEIRARNAAKRALRDVMTQVRRDVLTNASLPKRGGQLDLKQGLGSEGAYHQIPLPLLDPDAEGGIRFVPTDLHPGKVQSQGDLEAVLDALKDRMDNLSDMGEMQALRLQMALDRHAKAMSMMSNMLKKLSDTAAGIVQNLK